MELRETATLDEYFVEWQAFKADIKRDWRVKKNMNLSLTSTCNITTGKLDSNAADKNGKYPYFTCAPEPLTINTYAFDGDVILLAGNNASGNFHCQRYNGKFNAYQRTYVITAKKGFDIDYIYYNLKINLQHFKTISQGSQTKFLTMQILEGFQIPNIPFKKQKELGKVLSSLDSKINNNIKLNAKLEATAKSIYEYWFLQFEFPNEEGKPYKSSGGKMVWNEELKREIPDGWNVKPLNEIVQMVSGYPFSSNEYDDAGKYKLYTIKNIQDGNIISKVDTYIKKIPESMPKECLLHKEDILMSLTGNVGRVGLVFEENALLNQRVLKIIPKFNNIAYIYFSLRNDYIKATIENLAIGTSQKNLSPIELEKYMMLSPLKNINEKFANICNPIIFEIIINLAENQELSALRDFLMPLLMNGQVGFKNE